MTDFIVERIPNQPHAWQYDGTGHASWGEDDRSTWPDWLKKEHAWVHFVGGTLFYFNQHRSRMVNKGDWIVKDGDRILHFDSDEAFEKRYRRAA